MSHMDIVYILVSLVLVFCFFGFIQWWGKSLSDRQKLLEKEIEAIARKVVNDYGRTVARDEARKVYNETL